MKTLKYLIVASLIATTAYYFINKDTTEYSAIADANIHPDQLSVMEFLKKEDYTKNPNWHLFPGTNTATDTLRRLGLPVHGRWVRTYVNTIANDYIIKAKDTTVKQPLSFPPGSFIVKENYHSNFKGSVINSEKSELAVITLLYKPSPKFNYCATDSIKKYNGKDCYGGGWFYSFFFTDDMDKGSLSELSVTVQKNRESFCVTCHAPAYNTDYVRTLDNILNPFSEFSSTPYCDRFLPKDPSHEQKIASKTPDNIPEFTEEINTYINNNDLSPTLPSDVPKDPTVVFNTLGKDATQSMFNSFAWKTFIALNWPNKSANPKTKKPQRGEADITLPFQKNIEKSTVWETYKPTFEVFQPGIEKWNPVNQPWNQEPVNPIAACISDTTAFVLTNGANVRNIVNETGQAFAGSFGYLVDQDSSKVRYEVLFNRTEFEYLIGEGRASTANLTPAGPKGFVNEVRFPDNRDDVLYQEGAMEVKSAWKELCLTGDCNQQDANSLEEAKKRFLVRSALIYNEEDKTCRTAYMGLVGLHIIRKTYYAPQWVWITFEHKDNVPDANAENKTGTFYNSDPNLKVLDNCAQLPFLYAKDTLVENCPNVDLNRFNKALKNQPNQLTRLVPIDSITKNINTQFQNQLAAIDSPFANYVLVNTQWSLNGRRQDGGINKLNCKDNDLGEDCFTMVPRFLRNSVIESYMTDYCELNGVTEQESNRSCLSCHGTAGVDLSYIWLDAVSQRVLINNNN